MPLTYFQPSQVDSSFNGYLRNRIINGAMVIDQRYSGASVAVNTSPVFPVDRFYASANASGVFTAQQSTVVPTGFKNSIALTVTTPRTSISSTDVYGIRQAIEGYNIADFGWGAAGAATVTLSFWVRSSIAGTYTVSLFNSAFNRSYVATYAINSANAWEQKFITVPGDTAGTWATDNTAGVTVYWDLGSGSNYNGTAGVWNAAGVVRTSGSTNWISTNGATFYLTGCQLEVGVVATPLERRQYGQELSLCYRYYRKYINNLGATYVSIGNGITGGTTQINRWGFTLDVPMRTAPAVGFSACVGWNGTVGTGITASTSYSTTNVVDCDLTTGSLAATVGFAAKVLMTANGYIELGAEL